MLSDRQMNLIAERMADGLRCFWNLKNDHILFMPQDREIQAMEEHEFEEKWGEVRVLLETFSHRYLEIMRPDEENYIGLMKSFVKQLPKSPFTTKLKRACGTRNPIMSFNKSIILDEQRFAEWEKYKLYFFDYWITERIENCFNDNAYLTYYGDLDEPEFR